MSLERRDDDYFSGCCKIEFNYKKMTLAIFKRSITLLPNVINISSKKIFRNDFFFEKLTILLFNLINISNKENISRNDVKKASQAWSDNTLKCRKYTIYVFIFQKKKNLFQATNSNYTLPASRAYSNFVARKKLSVSS